MLGVLHVENAQVIDGERVPADVAVLGEPLCNHIIVSLAAFRHGVLAQVVVVAINADAGLAGRLVQQVRRFSFLRRRGFSPLWGSVKRVSQFRAALPLENDSAEKW